LRLASIAASLLVPIAISGSYIQPLGPQAKVPAAEPKMQSSPRVLPLTSSRTMGAPAFSFLAPQSDEDGNLFIRPNVGGADDIVLFKLAKDDDSENRMYRLPPQASQANEFIDFAVASSGQPYVLTGRREGKISCVQLRL
jgi:hypothetical protein